MAASNYDAMMKQLQADIMAIYGTPKQIITPEPKPEPALQEELAPTINGSVIGYRAWRIKDWQLTGTGVNRFWTPGINEATCDAGTSDALWSINLVTLDKHTAPGINCHCGFNALARFTKQDEHWHEDDIFGAIEAWSHESHAPQLGDVAEAVGVDIRSEHDHDEDGFLLHPTGFRSRFAKVVLLATDETYPRAKNAAIRALAAEHEADVCKREHLEDAAKEHGQLVPEEMLEWVRKNQPVSAPQRGSGAAFVPPTWFANQWLTTNQIRSSFSLAPLVPPVSRPRPITPQVGSKGIREALGYPGPPSHGKYRKHDRVKDRAGVAWYCTKGGNPGFWEREED